MSNPLPLVSFAIPSYNHEKYIGAMLDSCLAQTYPNIEVVVVDDASPDGSRQIIEDYVRRYPGIVRAEFNANNLGPALTARKAVRLTRGEFIAGIGSDDVSLPHRIAAGMALLLADPKLGAVFSKAEIIDETGRTIDSPIAEVFNCPYDDIRWRLLQGNFLCGPSMLVRGELVRQVSPNHGLGYVEDFDQCLRILDSHELLRVDDIWVKYRSHGRNLSLHTQDSAPFAGNYETAVSILGALARWPVDKLHTFQFPPGSPEYKQERAQVHCRLATHCIATDDTLFGRPFLLTSEAYRQALLATENDPDNAEAATLLAAIWKRLGDHPRAQGKKPIAFVDWQEQQGGAGQSADNEPGYAPLRPPLSFDAAYARWQQGRYFVPGDTATIEATVSRWAQIPKIHLVMRLAPGQENLLADTLDSLIQQLYGEWHLDIVTPLPAPDGLDELPCIGWHPQGNADETKAAIDFLATARRFDWIFEIPAGARLDPLCLWRLAEQATQQPDARALFVDDDCCDSTGQHHSPRFKPGCNPAALQAADLAGPVCLRHDAWLATGGAGQRPGSPWFGQLLRVAGQFGWKAIKHVPDILISYPGVFPSDPESCLNALFEHFHVTGSNAEIVPTGGQSWGIRFPLATTPKLSIAIVSGGQLDLLARCLNSILNTTRYPAFEIVVAVGSTDDDPELADWLTEIGQRPAPAIRVVRSADNYAATCNAAVAAATGDFVALIRDEAVIIQANWLEELARSCLPPDIAGASPRLITPGDGLIRNGGSVLGFRGIVGAPYEGKAKLGDPGYLDGLLVARDVATLPAACMMLRKTAYQAVGGMDETDLGNYFAEIDLCQKLRRNNQRLLYQPLATVVYGGSAELTIGGDPEQETRTRLAEAQAARTLQARWPASAAVDPFWNPNLSLAEAIPTLETDFRPQWQFLPSATPRFLARPLTNGQGVFRVTAPLRALRKASLASECIWNQDGPREPSNAELLRLAPDSVIVQHYVHDRFLAALQSWNRLPNRPFIVYAMDDLLTDMAESNPFRKNVPANSRARLKYAFERCDRLVVSTEFLADAYRHMIADIVVVPNRLEQDIWLPLHNQLRAGPRPRIGWAGGTTHHGDLVLLKEIIEQTRHEADWVFFGMCPDEIRPLIAEFHPFAEFSEYPARLAAMNLDIAVAPLAQIPFNQGKSNLRLLEYGVLGIPVVCTDIDPYRGSPACCVANTASAWVQALRERIHDADARESEGDRLRQWVHQGYLLENHMDQWLKAHLPEQK
jgi:GT2 family glycosyltransferase/glycosyltransferase involved in cell wall biosynthesis